MGCILLHTMIILHKGFKNVFSKLYNNDLGECECGCKEKQE